MANINQIQVGSTVYDIEDQTARNSISNLADVATSGDYDDLSNKPTIPTVPTNVSAFTNDVGYLTSDDLLKMRSVTVATSGWTAGTLTSASGTSYTYYKEVAVTGMTANDFVDISNMGSASSYTGNYAVESLSGKFRIWVASKPSASTTWYVYYKVGMTTQS